MTTITATITDMLTETRINWRAVEAAGGNIAAIYAEAVASGDRDLARRAQRANERSAMRAARAGMLGAWLAR